MAAGGASARMGSDKILATVDGSPVLTTSLRTLRAAGIKHMVVGVRPGSADRVRAVALAPYGLDDVVLVDGGATRSETVRRCLSAVNPQVTHVVVHDAARPRCSVDLVQRVLGAAERAGAACAALPVVDTVHCARPDATIARTLDRALLWSAQTPQAFRRDLLEAAHAAGGDATDDAGMVAALGVAVHLVPGERSNAKLTYPEDLAPGAAYAVGYGQDVHRLVPGRALILGGVHVPHDRGLEGHSDADVLAHAVADAVLGAAALGDIGRHFPPSDERWRGADSVELLRRCVEMAARAGWRPAQADCLITAERPRLAPWAEAMRTRVAAALGCTPERVNVKAGTAEGLGALGREEGIGATAVVLMARIV